MLKEANRMLLAGLAAMLVIGGCGKKDSATKTADTMAAESLLQQAETALNQGKTELAQTLVDSINKAYPREIETRRATIFLQLSINEQSIGTDIEQLDSLIERTKTEYSAAMGKMRRVADPALGDYYWIASTGTDANFTGTTGVQGRVLQSGEFCVVSSVIGAGNLRHSSVTLSGDGGSASTGTVPYDGEANYRMNNSETVTYGPSKSDEFGRFAYEHRNRPLTLTFNGSGRKQIQLSAAQVNAIGDAWLAASKKREGMNLMARREYFSRRQDLARRQKEAGGATTSEPSADSDVTIEKTN